MEMDAQYPERISVRVVNFPKTTELHDIKSQSINKLTSIRGTVVRVSNTKPMLEKIGVRCGKCALLWMISCRDGIPQTPSSCAGPGCSSNLFSIVREYAVTTDWQRIRLQEIAETSGQGRVPITRDVEVVGEEVDNCVPGDVVMVVGIIRPVSLSETRGKGNRGVGRTGLAMPKRPGGGGRKRKSTGDEGENTSLIMDAEKAKAPIYDTYVEANSVQNTRSISSNDAKSASSIDATTDLNMLSVSEMYGVLQIANHPSVFALLVASLCPTIYGHELVKAGLLLSLFGGSKKRDDMLEDSSLRSDVHMLIVGDPGMGKSQLLTSVNKLAPRGVFVGGTSTSTTGLTVSIQKEQGSHDYVLEAGALVLANNGVACIDELDKMSQLDALLEAMEQQQVSVAKAGIVCNLPAKTTILAAANPRHGHYDKSKTIAENLNMPSALLSRFDIIFVLLDKPDAVKDEKISEHIFAQHDHPNSASISSEAVQNGEFSQKELVKEPQVRHLPVESAPSSLLDRLRAFDPKRHQAGIIAHSLFNRYIGYAKRFVNPVLSTPARLVLQDFYLSLRRSHHSHDGTPVTTRQLESLIRLAEARAKAELRTEVTEADARDVIEIMKMSLRDALDADGFESVNVGTTGKRGKAAAGKSLIAELQKVARTRGNSIFTKSEMYEICQRLRLSTGSSFDDLIDSLNFEGYLIRATTRNWKVFGVD